MMNGESIFNSLDEEFFLELINDYGDNHIYSQLVETYLDLIAKKLSVDTNVTFYREGSCITNTKLGIKIDVVDTVDYDKLLDKIIIDLGGDDDSARNESQMINDWASLLDMSPYFDTEKQVWKAYDHYGQSLVFDIIYYGLYRTYDKKSLIGYDLENKYMIESNEWGKPNYYKGHIDELNIDVSFAKNGNMRITSKMPKEFWDNIEYFYSVVDAKGNHHRRYY